VGLRGRSVKDKNVTKLMVCLMLDEKGKKEVLPQTEDLPDGSTKSVKRIAELYGLDHERAKS
jgi:hypothetical protein